jgi:hypothetical protein
VKAIMALHGGDARALSFAGRIRFELRFPAEGAGKAEASAA